MSTGNKISGGQGKEIFWSIDNVEEESRKHRLK